LIPAWTTLIDNAVWEAAYHGASVDEITLVVMAAIQSLALYMAGTESSNEGP
jgi:hypothetical protein